MLRCLRFALIPLILFGVACNRDPQAQSRKLVENGNKFFARAKFKEASIMYRRALGKDGKNAEAYYRLGLTAVKLNAYADAAAAFRRTLDLQKNNVDAAVKLGDIYWLAYASQPGGRNNNLLLEIEDVSKNLLARDPKSFDGLRFAAYREYARVLAAADPTKPPTVEQWAQVAPYFAKANAAKPYDPDLSIVYGSILLNANQQPTAEALAKGVLERNKNYAPIYQFLVRMYVTMNRVEDAESVLRQQVQNNPKQDLFRVQLATFYLGTRKPEEAEKVLQGILSNKTDFPYGRMSIGNMFLRLGDYDRARREYEAGVAEGGAKKPDYQKAVVGLLTIQGKPVEALALTEEILKADPKDSAALAQRASLSITSGDQQRVQAAANDLQALVSKNPTNHVYRFHLARALLAKGQLEQARTHLEESIRLYPTSAAKVLLAQIYTNKGDYQKSLQVADEVIKLEPGNVQARVIRTASLLGMKDVNRAKSELQEIVEKAPKNIDAQFQLAMIYFGERNYKDASALFNRMNTINPLDNRGSLGLMESEVAQRNFPAAIEMVRAALAKDPKRVDMKVQLGNVLARAGQFDEAVKIFQDLVHDNAKAPELYMKLGEAYRLKGDVNQAVENYKKAAALAPNETGPLMRVGLMLEGVGRGGEAKPMYEQVVRMDPTNVVALNNLAFMKAEEGSDLDQALAFAQRAKQRAPQDPNVADTLGWVYIKKNLSDDAVRVFQEIVKQNPSNATYRYHLAMALFQKGDRPAAKKQCEQALQNNPSKDEVGKLKDLLAKLG